MDFELQNSKLIASKENTKQKPIPVDSQSYKNVCIDQISVFSRHIDNVHFGTKHLLH